MNLRKVILLGLLSGGCVSAIAQYDPEAAVNPNSLFNIPVYEQVFKVRVWREMFLREKQNKGFFARGNEMSRIILQGIKSGEITKIYENDSLSEYSVKTKEEFFQGFQLKTKVIYPVWDQNANYIVTDRVNYNGVDYECLLDNYGQLPDAPAPNDYWQETSAGQAVEFQPTDMHKPEIMEDIIFDKRRSRLYYDIQAIQLYGWDDTVQAFRPLGWIKYKDVEKVFRAHPEKAIWFNRQNTAQNRNLADAFLLRLFHATIKKVQNPDDLDLSYIYNQDYKTSVYAREWEEMKLMEKEHNLWEY
jgi:gliding motility associated protien GldN